MTTTTAATVTGATTTAAAATNALGKTSADFNMFLKLLTTQMQNQDPLKPMDSTEYTAQLAQFSQVEQTIQQTGTLKDILSRLSGQDLAQASGLIGREAEGGPVPTGWAPPAAPRQDPGRESPRRAGPPGLAPSAVQPAVRRRAHP